MVSHNTTTNVQNVVINFADLNTFNMFFMKKIVLIIFVSSLICSCNNHTSGNNNSYMNNVDTSNDSITTGYSERDEDTVYNYRTLSKEPSYHQEEIVGYWTEYRTDNDTYLLGHFSFNANGTGSWILTGGLDNDTENRGTIDFEWYQDESGNIVTEYENGETETLSYKDGVIVKPSVAGNEIYRRDDIVSTY